MSYDNYKLTYVGDRTREMPSVGLHNAVRPINKGGEYNDCVPNHCLLKQ